MLKRAIAPKALALASQFPVLTLTGPRQSGKTTLVRALFDSKPYVSLEDPDIRAFAREDARGFLSQFPEGAVLDEIQRAPDLLSYIQGLVDSRTEKGLFILTGGQQFELAHTLNQSLAGRTALLKLLPLSLAELRQKEVLPPLDRMLLQGFYPRLHQDGLHPTDLYSTYFETYVERDLRHLSQIENLRAFEKFVRLLAGRIGQLLNLNSLAGDAGISHVTASRWISILEASYIVFLLQPLHANIGKRLVKSPKVYFHDVGLASYLLGLESETQMRVHPLKGNLFENMVTADALKARFNRGRGSNLFFYRDSGGNEVDLVLEDPLSPLPVEVKAGETLHGEFLKGIRRFREAFGKPEWPGRVIYGGSSSWRREGVDYLPWTALGEERAWEREPLTEAGAEARLPKP